MNMKKIFICIISAIIFVFIFSFTSINSTNTNKEKDIKDKRIEALEGALYMLNEKLTEKTDSLEIYKEIQGSLVVGIYVISHEYYAYNAISGFYSVSKEDGNNIISSVTQAFHRRLDK